GYPEWCSPCDLRVRRGCSLAPVPRRDDGPWRRVLLLIFRLGSVCLDGIQRQQRYSIGASPRETPFGDPASRCAHSRRQVDSRIGGARVGATGGIGAWIVPGAVVSRAGPEHE